MEATKVKEQRSGVAEALVRVDEAVREQEVMIDQLNDKVQVVSAGLPPDDMPPNAHGSTPDAQEYCDVEDYLYNIMGNINRNTFALARITGRLRI